ncbi:MAG: membrane protein insertase YidC, partial [Flavobacteriaceae bacterium]|nr:membrane protein insertase YidC [Flavobacteriaceae bacterium]
MEEKKLDVNSIVGFVLIFGILIYMFYINQPTAEELAAQKQQEQVEQKAKEKESATADYTNVTPDAVETIQEGQQLGAFKLATSTASVSELSNDKLSLKVSH